MSRRLACLVLLFAGVPALCAAAPAPSWQSIGPDGATVTAMAVDPRQPGVVYAGTDQGGVYRSADGGLSWKSTGLTNPFLESINSLAVGPSVLYAGGRFGLFVSHNGGATWRDIGNFERVSVAADALAVDPVRGTLLVILGTGAETRMHRSSDEGRHWTKIDIGPHPQTITVDAGSPGTCYAGTFGGIYRSSDGGVTWKLLSLHALDNRRLRAVAVDPVTHAVYAGGSGPEVFSSTDRGATWRSVTLPDGFGVSALAAHSGFVYAGASKIVEQDSFNYPFNAFFISLDGGASWRRGLDGTGNAAINAVVTDPHKPRTVYIGAYAWGVLKSTDAVAHWAVSNRGLHGVGVAQVAVDPSHPATLWAGTSGSGLWKTVDGGRTWRSVYGALGSTPGLALDPQHPGTVFAAGQGGLVVRSLDGGAHWRTFTQGLENVSLILSLKVDPQRPGAIYAGTYNEGIFLSRDGGATWSAAAGSIPPCTGFLSLSISVSEASAAPGTVFAVGFQNGLCSPDDSSQAGGLFASTDGGATWEDRTNGLDRKLFSVAVDPNAPATLYAGGTLLERSTDEGASWQRTALQAGYEGTYVFGLTVAPDSTVYAGITGLVYASTDGGASWSPLGGNSLKGRNVDDLVYDPATGKLYAAAQDGLFSLATR